ncbi:MAG: T9SS type A sorting domain-containing protein, partial [Candidatus Marinimicrobia bacterium]|nr:T9SS type A sorting domain-containing protein [Candidatus Neomarinimicrobiota bacterium]
MAQNYPNPFSGTTLISYQLNKSTNINIKIFNILGQEINVLKTGSQSSGVYGLYWDGRDKFGKKVSPGVYFCQLQAGNDTRVKKMLYGIGGMNVSPVSHINLATSKTVPAQKIDLQKAERSSITAGTFTAQIKNTDSTIPWIKSHESNDILIQSDTTIDFIVQEDIIERYLLYVGTEDNGIHVYDTELHAFVDSLTGFPSLANVTATKSGEKLYVSTMRYSVYPYDTTYPAMVYSVDLQTKERKIILSKSAQIFFSPNGV